MANKEHALKKFLTGDKAPLVAMILCFVWAGLYVLGGLFVFIEFVDAFPMKFWAALLSILQALLVLLSPAVPALFALSFLIKHKKNEFLFLGCAAACILSLSDLALQIWCYTFENYAATSMFLTLIECLALLAFSATLLPRLMPKHFGKCTCTHALRFLPSFLFALNFVITLILPLQTWERLFSNLIYRIKIGYALELGRFVTFFFTTFLELTLALLPTAAIFLLECTVHRTSPQTTDAECAQSTGATHE